MRNCLSIAVCTLALTVLIPWEPSARSAAPIEWQIDNLQRIGGHAVTIIGSPHVVQTDKGPAVEFDGKGDGLVIESNPLEGLGRFTVEVLFQPSLDGGEEQRFVHFQETTGENRALIELRLTGGRFALDTYLRSTEPGLALLDRARTHAAGEWHVASLTYDGKTMAHAVDGVRELAGDVAFTPLGGGRTSIGMRQNRVSFFKGRIQ